MNQNLLLKYISGKASQREKEEVAAWIDADAANLKEFMSLRKSYDALVWQDADELKTGRDKLLSLRTFTMKAMRIAAIFVLAFGLSYILIQTLQKENVEMQTVYVPAGQRTQVTLADGTMVWVNGKSTLTFPSQFASRTRKVELDGEAYFEVQKDPEKQFIVSTAHQSAIKVLGTKLADRYDVEFIVRRNVPDDDLFSGTFTSRSLEQILNYIEASSKIRWRYLNSVQGSKEKMKIEIFI